MASAISDHLFLYNSYNFSNGSNLSFFEENAQVLKASFADKTASLTSFFEPKDISAQTSSVAGLITLILLSLLGETHLPLI